MFVNRVKIVQAIDLPDDILVTGPAFFRLHNACNELGVGLALLVFQDSLPS